MICLSRREMLRFLLMALPSVLVGCKGKGFFDQELVCIHVYALSQPLPKPLIEKANSEKERSMGEAYFQIGMPELILCLTQMKLLDMFQYFWPVSRSDIRHLQRSITILYQKRVIESLDGLDDFVKVLEKQNNALAYENASQVAILTMNDYTMNICPALVDICRSNRVDELVILKDPSRPPYLCSHPSQQKGFKRPPPYLSGPAKTFPKISGPLYSSNQYRA